MKTITIKILQTPEGAIQINCDSDKSNATKAELKSFNSLRHVLSAWMTFQGANADFASPTFECTGPNASQMVADLHAKAALDLKRYLKEKGL